MSLHPRRRAVLKVFASGSATLLAGCLGGGSAGTTSTTAPTQESTTTEVETDTTTIETHTCDEQGVVPDVEVRNKRDEPVIVTLTVEDRTTGTLLFESTYDVPANELTTEEDDTVFSSLDPETDHQIWATATVGEQSDTEDVSVVAQTPLIRGIAVAVTSDGVAVFDYHADPGPRVNWDCYPRD
ncbi:hypothetical protein GJR96_06980 [Haloferax sp. MBLA0076]|uniref:Lipoprotein n=1 Tax=Haloferax litoreum TaxID=2666140 RepID=A0A6A8GFK1_9EURY|nr:MULTISPECIES: hypothetical protein [Haloferax]KAB1193202.1 hypothetical protein Hfx1148_06970 [Haloferax sp. CBA1148]MRX21699.1 hypothetical protein [Haloferax litoreum]